MKKVIEAVIGYIIDRDRILLVEKKKGHGMGKWNGPGGKVENETPEECLIREVREEIGVEVKEFHKVGTILFYSVNEEDWLVHVYRITKYEGKPLETEEVKPRWFKIGEIPFDRMWEDDRHWLPYVIENKPFEAEFKFEGEKLINGKIRIKK